MTTTMASSLLERYIERLGLEASVPELRQRAGGASGQVVELLDDLLRAHIHAICFENLDVLAARARGEVRAVSVSLDEVADKLLRNRRGGYCHEHAVLFRGILAELGLAVYPVLARVHLGAGRVEPAGLTHQATIVALGSQRYLVDPGFGGGTPECALPLSGGVRATVRGEYRIVPAESALEPAMRAESEWVLQSRTTGEQEFRNDYAFADVARQRSDIEVSNWYTSTKPGTRFTGPPVLARSLPDSGKLTVEGQQLRYVRSGAVPERRERTITDAADFARVLTEDFELRVRGEFAALVWGANSQS
ncbi:arylamine N-acetyltransferase family protein [Brevibacterium renqingii]|uniref:arylamine N-acetyltransferase family protein n=1 Tax=Brevibacterium renqingii TaxID=2776916 RepID=UPI001AE06A60|nr:arylamine N-acetyltransferase [Brevibacterium renqingii]